MGENVARFAVKIGTLCENIEAIDTYDYKADCMVKNPDIEKQLAFFNLKLNDFKKTEKTVTEMEIDLNKNLGQEWDVIQESGKDLKPAKNHHGIENLGNTCYMASCLQALSAYPKIQTRFSSREEYHNKYANAVIEPKLISNLEFQTRKLFSSLKNGSSVDLGEHVKIRPRDFKKVVGKDHPEFSTCGQQDAQEFFSHFLDRVDKYRLFILKSYNSNIYEDNF